MGRNYGGVPDENKDTPQVFFYQIRGEELVLLRLRYGGMNLQTLFFVLGVGGALARSRTWAQGWAFIAATFLRNHLTPSITVVVLPE